MRKLTALLLAGFLVAGLVGCSSSDDKSEDVQAKGATTSVGKDDSENKDDKSSTTEEGDGSTDKSSSGSEVLLTFEDCLEVSLTYAGIYLSALSFDETAKQELDQAISEIEGKVPEEIKDDLQVIADGIDESSNFQEIGEFFETTEYKEADENITAYLDEVCGTGASGG